GCKKQDLAIFDLRKLADALLKVSSMIDKSPEHEAIWLNAFSYCMRPGLGDPGDELRLRQTWKLFRDGARSGRDTRARSEWAILWRRVSIGLDPGRQSDLYQRNKKVLRDRNGAAQLKNEGIELWRMFACFEHLSGQEKGALGDALWSSLATCSEELGRLCLWAIGRLGTRQPCTGLAENVLPREKAQLWIRKILEHGEALAGNNWSTLVELARKSGDRALDIDEALREEVMAYLESLPVAEEQWRPALTRPLPASTRAQDDLIGESLPSGLILQG
ncbi:MAG: hypothetical protein HQL31_03130, partial [Planctomycetes bacterium]|nr:hypothetical protein [Planctomycetota bacterium]